MHFVNSNFDRQEPKADQQATEGFKAADPNRRLAELLRYRSYEFSVIPLHPRTKEPSHRWTDYMSRRASEEEIRGWYQSNPDMNAAVVTGAVSNIVVVDIDGQAGFDAIAKFGDFPVTPTVTTNRGKHLYFRHPGFNVRSQTLFPKVDLRGEGGCVVVPPSVHPSGAEYRWEVGLEVGLADLPDWLLKLVKRNDETESRPRASSSRRMQSEIGSVIGDLLKSKKGERNNDLNKASFLLGRYVGAGDLDEDEAYDTLIGAAQTLGLSRKEARSTVQSGLEAGKRQPKQIRAETYQLLDYEPHILERPLQMVDGKPLCVTWVPIASSDGDPEKQRYEMVVFDGEHQFYSKEDLPGSKSLDELNLRIDLPFELDFSKRLSPKAFAAFIKGYEPDPKLAFEQIQKAIDAFVSFESADNDESAFSKLVACWTFGTYFMEAFAVVGYLWPNGERGSGKTQLLTTVSTLSYLGTTVTSGSSFACLRDEAHYGATIAFDDCENVRDMEPYKRELLLAGSTRGARVKHKETDGQKGWRSRSISSFSPKLFSAIRLPDETLDSRTIRLPMVASSDKEKTRRSPMRVGDWPVDVRKLVDDMWLSAVLHLPMISECERAVEKCSSLENRSLDNFRMPLTMAYWLEKHHGVTDLFEPLMKFADVHQQSKTERGGMDSISLALYALWNLISGSASQNAVFATRQIADAIAEVARQEEADSSVIPSDVARIGALLGALGFDRAKHHGKARSWNISKSKVLEQAKSRGVQLQNEMDASRASPLGLPLVD